MISFEVLNDSVRTIIGPTRIISPITQTHQVTKVDLGGVRPEGLKLNLINPTALEYNDNVISQ